MHHLAAYAATLLSAAALVISVLTAGTRWDARRLILSIKINTKATFGWLLCLIYSPSNAGFALLSTGGITGEYKDSAASTANVTPEIYEAAGDNKNKTADDTSASVPKR